MEGGTTRGGDSRPGRSASVDGLWQRLYLRPLPHQHCSLDLRVRVSVIGGGRPSGAAGSTPQPRRRPGAICGGHTRPMGATDRPCPRPVDGRAQSGPVARQLLLDRAVTPVPAALERMGTLQAQYAPSMYVGLWSRVEGFRRGDLTKTLESRRVVQGRCSAPPSTPGIGVGLLALTADSATEHLVRRYLGGYGPSTCAEVADWTGLPAAEVTPVLDRAAASAVPRRRGHRSVRPPRRSATGPGRACA